MPTKISDLHIAREDLLPAPRELHVELPVARPKRRISPGRAPRAGDPARRGRPPARDCRSLLYPRAGSAIEYARRLRDFSAGWPTRSTGDAGLFREAEDAHGWKGLIYDPDLDGRGDIGAGLRRARRILLDCARMGVPAASEILTW